MWGMILFFFSKGTIDFDRPSCLAQQVDQAKEKFSFPFRNLIEISA